MVTPGVWAYLCVQENETLSIVLTDGDATVEDGKSFCNSSARKATLSLVLNQPEEMDAPIVDIVFFFGGVSMCGRKR